MQIKRDIYLNELIRHRHNGLFKVITGLRRCGKSYLCSICFTGIFLKVAFRTTTL